MTKYKVAGVMSGTSLDGLDIAVCEFAKKGKHWSYTIVEAITIPYDSKWRKRLSQAHQLPATELLQLNAQYGEYIGRSCSNFFNSKRLRGVDFIASHGHTIFHQPESGFTYQLGDGLHIHAASGLAVVFDFRSLDVTLGGQGAPLVPVGDYHLFRDYEVCLNIGGIANLSMQQKGKRVAFDICYANMGLNYLSGKKGKEFDRDGKLAAAGKVNTPTLKRLQNVYKQLQRNRPSLAREGFERAILPIINESSLNVEDLLATFCESVAIEIVQAFPAKKQKLSVLATGGGALNKYLISRIQHHAPSAEVIVADIDTVKFKEAMVFAFLGVLRVRGEINVYKSATGASRDSSSGLMAGFPTK